MNIWRLKNIQIQQSPTNQRFIYSDSLHPRSGEKKNLNKKFKKIKREQASDES